MPASSNVPYRDHRVTPSDAHDWDLCGGFFEARKREVRHYPPAYPIALGTAVHELLAAYNRMDHTGTFDSASFIARHWRPGHFKPEEDASAREEAAPMLDLYHQVRLHEQVEVLESEAYARLGPRVVGDNLRIDLRGRIDRLGRRGDGTLEVLDYKTAALLPSEQDLRRDLATTVYHLLAQRRVRAEAVTVVQLSLRSGGRSEVMLDAVDVEHGKERLRAMVRELASSTFHRTPGEACTFCPAGDSCPRLTHTDPAQEQETL